MKRSPVVLLALYFALGPLTVVSCGPDEPAAKSPSAGAEPTPTPTPTHAATVEAPPPPPPPPPAVEVVDLEPSPDPKPLPTVKIIAPGNDLSVGDKDKAKDYEVRIEGRNLPIFKGGSHFHLILDNYPYKPIYDTKTPVKLTELLPAGTDLTEGQHALYSFPSRPTHESVKAKGSASMVTFWVGKKGKPAIDPKRPMLVYSRPKGDNFGDMAKNVMIDFYLMNTTLADGSKVKYTITGGGMDKAVTGEFTRWAPKIIHNLQKGEYAVKLELLDKDGKLADTTTRHIKVDADQPLDPAMGMAPMTMGSTMPPMPETSAKPAPNKPAPKSSK